MDLFTYGSLMFDEVWRSVVGGAYGSTPAVLAGFQRKAVKGESYPALIPGQPQDRVSGRLWLNVNTDDTERLDAFEGAQYRRISCELLEPVGRSAQAYLFLRGDLVDAPDWDADWFARIGIHEFRRSYGPTR